MGRSTLAAKSAMVLRDKAWRTSCMEPGTYRLSDIGSYLWNRAADSERTGKGNLIRLLKMTECQGPREFSWNNLGSPGPRLTGEHLGLRRAAWMS